MMDECQNFSIVISSTCYSGFSSFFIVDFPLKFLENIVIVDFPFSFYSGFSFIVDFHGTRDDVSPLSQ